MVPPDEDEDLLPVVLYPLSDLYNREVANGIGAAYPTCIRGEGLELSEEVPLSSCPQIEEPYLVPSLLQRPGDHLQSQGFTLHHLPKPQGRCRRLDEQDPHQQPTSCRRPSRLSSPQGARNR